MIYWPCRKVIDIISFSGIIYTSPRPIPTHHPNHHLPLLFSLSCSVRVELETVVGGAGGGGEKEGGWGRGGG